MSLKRKALMVFAGSLVVSAALAADPSLHEVYEAARTGRVDQAQQMMAQVLRDHPNSAKAHYVAAQVDARAHQFGLAQQELKTAEQLEPGLPFVPAEDVRALQREITAPAQSRGMSAAATRAGSAGTSWGLILLLVSGAVLLWMWFRRRSRPAVYPGYPGYPGAASGTPVPGPMGVGPMMGPGAGSGLLGSLGTGLAVGAGVAAGEELVRHMLEPGAHSGGVIPSAGADEAGLAPNSDMGGRDFGVSDGGSWDDGGLTGGDLGGGGDDWT